MLPETLDQVVQFIIDHFQLLMSLNGVYLILMFAAYLVVNFTTFPWKEYFNRMLLSMVMVGGFTMLFFLGFTYWDNFRQGLCVEILPDTHWAKSKIPVYFVTGKSLAKVNVDGTEFKYVLEAEDDIREYYFSPDGNYLLIATEYDLYLYNQQDGQTTLLESVRNAGENIQGFISQIKWAPDSKKFCYAVYRWSPISSQDSFYVFYLDPREKKPINVLRHKIQELWWDQKGENLYYSRYEIMSLKAPLPYEIQLYRIGMDTLKAEGLPKFRSAAFQMASLPFKDQGIELYIPTVKLNYSRGSVLADPIAVSDRGTKAVFESNYSLYYVKANNRRIKLYRFVKEKKKYKIPIKEMMWLPGGQFLIMTHEKLGVLAVKPSVGKMGRLFDYPAEAVGVYVTAE